MTLQAACNRQQQAVATDQAERRIHALELVEIDEDYRRLHGIVGLGPHDDGFQPVDEQLAIGQPCQAAVHGIVK